MNEILRAKALTAEIMARAAAIKGAMADVNQRINNMQDMEQQAQRKKAELQRQQLEATRIMLTDLPDDALRTIARMVRQYEGLVALSKTCRRLQSLVNTDASGWESMSREDWGISEPSARSVPCLANILIPNPASSSAEEQALAAAEELRLVSPTGGGARGAAGGGPGERMLGAAMGGGAYAMGSCARLASLVATTGGGGGGAAAGRARASADGGGGGRRSEAGEPAAAPPPVAAGDQAARPRPASALPALQSAPPPAPSSKPCLWRNIYRDRVQGWRMVRSVLRWLQDHNSPHSVSGSLHRLQLHLALRYMELGTAQPQDQSRKQLILQHSGLKSLLALLDNNSGGVQELALSVLANLIYCDAETKVQVQVGSRMGKMMCDKLDASRTPGVVRQASRALVNLWAVEGVVPEVVPLLPDNQPASPVLESGYWQLQEFSLRGEGFNLLHMLLSFHGDEVHGQGCDRLGDSWEQFQVEGRVDWGSREWRLQRKFDHVEYAVLYSGYLDAHGAWGVYTSQRSHTSVAFAFASSSSRQPRVFRLFRDAALLPPHLNPRSASAAGVGWREGVGAGRDGGRVATLGPGVGGLETAGGGGEAAAVVLEVAGGGEIAVALGVGGVGAGAQNELGVAAGQGSSTAAVILRGNSGWQSFNLVAGCECGTCWS